MKGMVVGSWIETWKKLYGEKAVDSAMQRVGIEKDRVFTPLEDVADNDVYNMLEVFLKSSGKTRDEVLKETGKENIYQFYRYYPNFFKKTGLLSFMSSMNDVHASLTRRMKNARPPLLDFEITGDTEIKEYRTKELADAEALILWQSLTSKEQKERRIIAGLVHKYVDDGCINYWEDDFLIEYAVYEPKPDLKNNYLSLIHI